MPKIENKSEEQKVAEAGVESFRKDLGPFVVAAETTAMVFTDAKEPGHPIIFANDSFLSLTGYDREEVLGHRFSFLMARGADPKGVAQVEAAFAGGTDHGSEIRYRRKDGSMFWAAIFIRTDSRPEHRDDHEQIIAVNLGSRPHCARKRLAPRNVDGEGSRHVQE